MLARSYRISKNILSAIKTPYRFLSGEYFSLKLRPNDLSHPRFSIIVSKKINKRAVVRNTLRRKISHAIDLSVLEALGYDVLIYAKSAAQEKSSEVLGDTLIKLLTPYIQKTK